MCLIKGGGGSLHREKMVEVMSKKFICIVDETKLCTGLGPSFPLPVEITPFCHEHTMRVVAGLPELAGCTAVLRTGDCSNNKSAPGEKPAVTDNGNYIVDLDFKKRIADFIRYRRVIVHMNTRFPTATAEELQRVDATCIVCREEMTHPHAKKLPCGHIFHFDCLRSWLEENTTCPTCRNPVEIDRAPTHAHAHAPQQAAPPAPAAVPPAAPAAHAAPAAAAAPAHVVPPPVAAPAASALTTAT
jgi:hypothetical protein